MTLPHVVFLFDVDNTLLDNDRETDDLKRHLEQTVWHERQENCRTIFERLTRIIHEGSSRKRAGEKRDGHSET